VALYLEFEERGASDLMLFEYVISYYPFLMNENYLYRERGGEEGETEQEREQKLVISVGEKKL
jgi:hypothetical protein